ncbi:hypothetical protein [Pseudomonas sp. F8002]|uniref:hypothetical protein n=1 Tax=Pseudomonas sp. F8002 TaxID=2738822 RepID=UPI0015A240C2|nr:hypothetical protein [Pseudomonas sp. F8002]NWB53794.1 hypothetical protein [Pseudomonas sp. F8002]
MTIQRTNDAQNVGAFQSPAPTPPVSSGISVEQFSGWNDYRAADRLLRDFDKYADPAQPDYITRDSLRQVAYSSAQSSYSSDDMNFARSLLENPVLMEKLDGYGKHKHDGKIDRQSIITVGQNMGFPLATMSDRDLAQKLLNEYDTYYPERGWGGFDRRTGVTYGSLKNIADGKRPDRGPDEAMVAREILSRPELMDQLGISDWSKSADRGTINAAIKKMDKVH